MEYLVNKQLMPLTIGYLMYIESVFSLNGLLAETENSRFCQIMPEFDRFSRKIPDFAAGMAKSRKCRHFPNAA